MQRLTGRSIVLVLFETTLIIAAVWVAAYMRLGDSLMPVIESDNGLVKMLLVAGAVQASMYFSGLYDVSVFSDRATLLIRLVQALAITSLVLAVLYFWFPDLIVGRGVFAIAAAFVFVLVIGWRLLFDFFGRRVAPAAH
jgi:FlaA1/EpsC-like NDP-sugar epimerase